MSQLQASPTSPPSSPQSSKTFSEAEQTERHEIRFAESEQDICAIHAFLLIVAKPALHDKVNFMKSLEEVARVVRKEAALMLFEGEVLVGTMGLIRPTWWYGDGQFLTDRWHFVLPSHDGTEASQMLMDEAERIAIGAGLKFFHQGRARKRRDSLYFMWPRIAGD